MRKQLIPVLEWWKGGGKSWYVRPSGGSYGDENGTSYDNAWDGFADIDTSVQRAGDTVYIAGTHNELFPAAKLVDGVRYVSLIADPATLSGQDVRNICIDCTGKSNITFTDLILDAAVVSCLNIDSSTNIVTNNCTFSNSGNQGIQHLGVVTATHNNPTLTGNADDGISVHDDGIVYVVGGTFSDNDQQINIISNAKLYLSGNYTFSGTATYDLFVTNASSAASAVITVNSAGTFRNVRADNDAKLVLNGATVTGTTTVTLGGNLDLVDSIVQGNLVTSGTSTLNATRSRLDLIALLQGIVNFTKCRITDEIVTSGAAVLTAEYTFFTGNTVNELVDIATGGTGKFKYCVFRNAAATQFCLAFRTGALTDSYANNCTLIGTANVGRGLFSQIDLTTNNNIAYDLEIGYLRSAGTSVLNNWCFFDCTTPKSGTVTSNNEVTGNPNFVDAGSDDYRLGASSSCINTGATLAAEFETGILSADWADASTVPTIETVAQSGAWDIGAYVNI